MIYNEFYKDATGPSYLSNYLRDPRMHHMWRADYFGQEHWVTTKETHFVEMPPSTELPGITNQGKPRILEPDQPRLLAQYRDPSTTVMNMTFKVLTGAPRAFEIPNFLSSVEVDHILDVAHAMDLHSHFF